MKSIDARLFADINKNDRRAVDKSAGGDGTRLRILYGRIDASSHDAGGPGWFRLLGLRRLSLLRGSGESEERKTKNEGCDCCVF